MKQLKRILQHKLVDESGSVSLYFIIFMVFFLPFAIWIGVQLPIRYELGDEVTQLSQNSADSIISRLDQTSLANGDVKINETKATEVADAIVQESLNLDENFQPSGNGALHEKVPVHIQHIEDLQALPTDPDTGTYVLPRDVGVYVYLINTPPTPLLVGDLSPIDHTSVIVQANVPIEDGGAFGMRTVIHRTGVSEAQIYTGGES